SDERDDSLVDGSSSSSDSSGSDEESGNEDTSSLAEDFDPMRGDEGLTTNAIRNLKCSIAEEVRIIDLEFPKYPEIEGKYNFYGFGWMSEEPGYYYPTLVREFYANYIAIFEGLCKNGHKSRDEDRAVLAEDRAVLVASLMYGFPLNMGVIIVEEIN
ncbi:hypothetical protein HAX54_048453, partial [Datura stramonium]|nr:hypothetical protein [Datura stramonium]